MFLFLLFSYNLTLLQNAMEISEEIEEQDIVYRYPDDGRKGLA